MGRHNRLELVGCEMVSLVGLAVSLSRLHKGRKKDQKPWEQASVCS